MHDDLCFLTATELTRRIQARELSAVDVMTAHLTRIERTNPAVNAIVTLLPDRAMEQARRADDALARGVAPGPLHGLPIAHKDLVEARGVRTTYGSRIYADFVPDFSHLVVERLQAAGALTIGKTNTPEFGAGSQTFNEVFGATRNPYDLALTCGGSSGGAAAALATGMLPVADGSDLGGSLRNPAAFCNVVGFRPSPGRVPNYPAVLPWDPLVVLGPMARTVEDVALLLSAMAGWDARSPIAIAEPGERFREPLARDVKGVRIAWCGAIEGLPVDSRITEVLEAARPVFGDLGCEVEQACPDFAGADEAFRAWRAWAFAATHAGHLARHRGLLKDTVIWNIEEGLRLTGVQLAHAERQRAALYERVRVFMERYEYLLLPVTQVLPFPVTEPYPTEINGVRLETYLDWMRSCYYISATGHPAVSVPAGFTRDGLPVGLQIVGRHHADFGVLQLAHAFEAATGFWRRRPSIAAG